MKSIASIHASFAVEVHCKMFQTNAISKHTVTRSLPVTRVCPAWSPLDRRGALLGIVGLIATTTATEAALAADEFGTYVLTRR